MHSDTIASRHVAVKGELVRMSSALLPRGSISQAPFRGLNWQLHLFQPTHHCLFYSRLWCVYVWAVCALLCIVALYVLMCSEKGRCLFPGHSLHGCCMYCGGTGEDSFSSSRDMCVSVLISAHVLIPHFSGRAPWGCMLWLLQPKLWPSAHWVLNWLETALWEIGLHLEGRLLPLSLLSLVLSHSFLLLNYYWTYTLIDSHIHIQKHIHIIHSQTCTYIHILIYADYTHTYTIYTHIH